MVRITLTKFASRTFAGLIRKGLSEMSFSSLDYDLVDLAPEMEEDREEEELIPFRPTSGTTSRLVEALDIFIHSLQVFNCRYKGIAVLLTLLIKNCIHPFKSCCISTLYIILCGLNQLNLCSLIVCAIN